MDDEEYIKKLEAIVGRYLEPLRDIPFSLVIKSVFGFQVLPFDLKHKENEKLLDLLKQAANIAGKKARKEGIIARRANDVGTRIKPYVREALKQLKLQARTPITQSGKKKAMGYPDIEVTDPWGRSFYLECKTYNIQNIDTTRRAFYFSPPSKKGGGKIIRDTFHLLMSFQVEVARVIDAERRVYIPIHWRIYSLESINVNLKAEFNASNRQMYRAGTLLAEGDLR